MVEGETAQGRLRALADESTWEGGHDLDGPEREACLAGADALDRLAVLEGLVATWQARVVQPLNEVSREAFLDAQRQLLAWRPETVAATYTLWVGHEGDVRTVRRDGPRVEMWAYDSWDHLLATQTFSPHARVFVRSWRPSGAGEATGRQL